MASPPHPVAAGDTFTYSGSLSKTYAQSAPCPQPTSTTSAIIGITVTNSATTAPNSTAATNQKSVETDTFPTQATTTTTDQVVQNTASAFLLYSTTSKDSIGNTVATNFANAQQLDALPESPGSWGPNDPSATVTETLADGTAILRTVKSDGSYTDNETFVDGTHFTIAVDGLANGKPRDGGGVYTIGGTSFTYAPPSGGTITLTISGATTKTRTFPVWFTIPASYISDTFSDNGSQTLDPNCPANSSGATSGNQIVETYVVLDPVLGYNETRTTTSYVVNGFGPVCVKIADTLNSFYDYQNDTTKIDYQSQNGQPNSVDTILEYLGMTAPGSAYPSLRTQSTKAVSPVLVSTRIAAIEHTRAIERAQRIEALHNFALKFVNKGALR